VNKVTEEPPKDTAAATNVPKENLDFAEPDDYEDDGIGDELFAEGDNTLSYSKLMEFIAKNHPVDNSDPEEIKMYSILERITVKDYCFRLINPCGCYKAYKKARRVNKNFRQHERKKKFSGKILPEDSTEQPIQMKDDPSDSEMSNDEGQDAT
jgi:hypothetical protein